MSRYIDADKLRRNKGVLDTGFTGTMPIEFVYAEDIDNSKIADVYEVRHGYWKEETEYYDDEYSECNVRKVFACSICGRTERNRDPYCNCGAKMDGERNDTE